MWRIEVAQPLSSLRYIEIEGCVSVAFIQIQRIWAGDKELSPQCCWGVRTA